MTTQVLEQSTINDDVPLPGEGLVEGKVLHESIFWEEDDPRWKLTGMGDMVRHPDMGNIIEMDKDSYIWVFCGTRGAGKGLTMTRYAARAAWLYNMRIVSNYKIKFTLKKIDGSSRLIESEDLDLYRLLCFDEDYKHCLILLDEAPDIIGHMASQTWKNKLVNIFVREIRKNHNSLFLGAQFFYLIDSVMRDQVDLLVKCQDAFRLYGYGQGLDRGAVTLADIWDNSGQWTGNSAHIRHDSQFDLVPPDESWEFPGVPVMGAYDTYEKQDVWESLAKVDMHFKTYKVGEVDEEDESYLEKAIAEVETACKAGRIESVDLFQSMGELSEGQRQKIGRRLTKAGIKRGGHGRQTLIFDNFDMQKFIKG